jgi:uncharacterized membrane protein YhfC
MWQDYVIAGVVLLFTLSVWPMVKARTPVPYSTSVLMTAGAATLAVVYVTMGLWFSLMVELVATLLWGLVVWNRIRAAT